MMPRVVKALILDTLLGTLLGAVLLVIAGALDRTGMARAVLALPLPLAVAIVLGGILPFAVGFAATGLDHRSRPDDR